VAVGYFVEPVYKRYTAAASGDVVFHNDRTTPCAVTQIIVAAANSNTLNPDVQVKAHGKVIGSHPGIPAGGGFVASGPISVDASEDVTLTTTDPGGTVDLTLYVDWNPNG